MELAQPSGHRVHLEAPLAATAAVVFTALTDPQQLAGWWGPHGFTVPSVDLDLRVGGRYRFVMRPPEGDPFTLEGEFLEVEAPDRLAYTFRWAEPDPDDVDTVVTISLRDVGGSTRVTVDHGTFATEARRALHEEGWRESLERLRAWLASA